MSPEVSSQRSPFVLRAADDIDDVRFRRAYRLYFRYFPFFIYALYAASIPFPGEWLNLKWAQRLMLYIPKFHVEASNFKGLPVNDIRYYLTANCFLYLFTFLCIVFSTLINLTKGKKYPLSPDQAREIRYRHFISPITVCIVFLVFIPLPVWMDGRRGELLRNPLYMPLISATFLGLLGMVCAAASLCIGRARGRTRNTHSQ